MNIWLIAATAIALAMDAFAAAVCKGLSVRKMKLSHALICGAYFGGFQALMPLCGFYLAGLFEGLVTHAAPIISFILLAAIGANMIRNALCGKDEPVNDSFAFKSMLPLALATSIDAMVAGVSLKLAGDTNIFAAVVLIGMITFILSAVGVRVGNVFGAKYKTGAEIVGGVVLILIGIETLIEKFIIHLL